jgi:TatD DNase family protein
MKLIDAHCHLEPKDYGDALAVIERARQSGVVHAVIVGQLQGPGDFGAAIPLAARHADFLTPTVGIHPHDAAQATPADWAELERLAALPHVAAVGETGLDYFYNHSPREAQLEGFRRQCALARQLQKPIVIHVRDAHPDCLEVLTSEGLHEGMIHCFTGDTDQARGYLDLGFHLSISGVVTYKKTEALQAAVAFAPLERLMIETDSPYLAPLPHRGRKNEPGFVQETARQVARLKGLDAELLAITCARNTARLLGLQVNLD